MGYSVATPIKSQKAKAEMLAFLDKNFRHFNEKWPSRGPLGEDLSYDHAPCSIGFDYGAGTNEDEREFIFHVCYWMALKVGRKLTFPTKQTPDVHGSFAVICYDGYEHWPVCLDTDPETPINVIRVNKCGYKKPRRFWQRMFTDYKRLHKELQRLDKLWEERNG